MRILIQFPEGLKPYALKLAKDFEKEGDEVFFSGSPTFGACDLAIDEALLLKADKLIHFGHSQMLSKADIQKIYGDSVKDLDIIYITKEIEIPEEVFKILKDSCSKILYKKLGLVTNVSHLNAIKKVKDILKECGKEVFTSSGAVSKNEAQILGCDVSAATQINDSVDAFLYFGGGEFHPIGALLKTTKPFFVFDPFRRQLSEITEMRDKFRRIRNAKIGIASQAHKIGVLVSTKPGQFNLQLALKIKKEIESLGKAAYIITANTFDFTELSNFDVEAFVNTACPRIGIDDGTRIRGKPILNSDEFFELLELLSEAKNKVNEE